MDKSIWKFIDDSSLNGYTLIVPCVAIGNVGQLSCDLLISSLKMTKIVSVYSVAQIPVIGNDPYDLNSGNLSTACEVYKSDSRKLCILQLRSPLIFKYARNFLGEVLDTFKEKGIENLIVITSSYAHEKRHILSSPFRYFTHEESIYMERIKATEMVKHDGDGELKIFGGGFASLFYKICREKNVSCLILYKYCSEGDNIPDAYDMVKYLTSVYPLFSEEKDLISQLIQPVSWTMLFGRPSPQDIY